jgi:epoxyqueuosine reductase
MSPEELTTALKAEARRVGFDLVGATPAVTPPGLGRLQEWLACGFAGQMSYMADRASAYEHPRHVLPGAVSVLMLAVAYKAAKPIPPAAGQGTVARYAWGDDYHDLIRKRLRQLANFHQALTPGAAVRGVVDTAPLLERQFAQQAGLGWFGKNTMIVNRRLGSWFVLAALLTSEKLVYDRPADADHCGTCGRCLDACPTGALVEPYRLDARKCVSYLTVESRETMPAELREAVGQRVFGCDACQEACPWNQSVFQEAPGHITLELAEVFFLDDAAWRRRFRGTSLWRTGRSGLLRNAAIALGNRPHEPAVAALMRGCDDADPLVSEACEWALGQYE